MKSCYFTAKSTSLRECTSFEPFCVKIGWGGSDLHMWAGKKSQKVTRGSHRNDVSPLTQGLRYRAACDKLVLIDSLHMIINRSFLAADVL